MCTIGYGEYVIISYMGRTILSISAIIGIFLI